MAWMIVHGHCINCGYLFSFNPELVPSIRVKGEREPVCKDCITRANEARKLAGHSLFWIHPDAYGPQEVP